VSSRDAARRSAGTSASVAEGIVIARPLRHRRCRMSGRTLAGVHGVVVI
jgi:hypothetical protein